ncbi:putative cysteine-rich repeat secretory protein 17 [Raphanus sativus]|uniref:Cysteine-rich repeat secretory protein 17 n=1 Tax=Raphanus sativus TaxID=3726 RepID=A0A6J0LME8_RAPSA|nr:putative cysteine-rich repeat secretory protein 17 [Raphanus sativus]KAJ4894258.1 putative cysteine-rich repeat secretory protein 17 [Raphanus sativus]
MMYSSSSVLKRLILINFLAIQLLLISGELPLNTTNAYLNHKCLVSQGKYKPGSEYERDVNTMIKMFYSGSYKGFYLLGFGAFSTILQCRADSYGTKCHDCFATALAVLRRKCPWYKGMIIWFDQCLLAFSSIDSLGKIDYDNNFCMSNAKKLGGDKLAFSRTLNTLMDNLTTLATTTKSKDNYTMFSAGETWYKGDRMYGMVQCTYDLTPRACKECLVINGLRFKDCLSDKRGARFVGGTCTFRFEFYPFISEPVRNI